MKSTAYQIIITLIFVSYFSSPILQAKEATQSQFVVEQQKFLEESRKVGFEELDEACGDCVDPLWLSDQLSKFIKKHIKIQHKNTLNQTIDAYIETLEKLKTEYKRTAKDNKFIEVTDKKIEHIMNDYISKIRDLKIL